MYVLYRADTLIRIFKSKTACENLKQAKINFIMNTFPVYAQTPELEEIISQQFTIVEEV